jgi:hypothetical protein
MWVTIIEALRNWDRASESFLDFRDRVVRKDLEKLRVVLLKECVVGPNLDVTQIVSNKELWNQFINEFRDNPPRKLLEDRISSEHIADFFQLLHKAVTRIPDEGEPGSAKLWPVIQDAFREMRRSIMECVMPCLHVRHEFDPEREPPKDLWKRYPAGTWREKPWRVTPQPISLYRSVLEAVQTGNRGIPEFRALVAQRGWIVPLEESVERQLLGANSNFHLKLIMLLSAWRSSLLEKIESIERHRTGG